MIILRWHVVFRNLLRVNLGYIRISRIFNTGDCIGFVGLPFVHQLLYALGVLLLPVR